jgi:hypothetical protein
MARRPSIALATALVLLACQGPEEPATSRTVRSAWPAAGLSSARATGSSAKGSASAMQWERRVPPAAWLEGLPAGDAAAGDAAPAVGQPAWAALPLDESGQARLSLVRVTGASGTTVAVVDGMKHRHVGVPRALVHPVGSAEGLKPGDVALCARWTTPSTVCRIEQLEGGKVVRAAYDWAGVTKHSAVDHAEKLAESLRPLAFASYPLEGRRSRGQVVAIDRQRVWLLGESGHITKHPRHQVRRSRPAPALKDGSLIYAFRWGRGYQRGRVVEVLEPGLRFRIALEGDRPSDDFFVSHLAPAP